MIKIEITEPHKENPDVLVKIAGFLMDLAGHTLVKAPEEEPVEEGRICKTGLGDSDFSVKTKDGWVPIQEYNMTPDELPGPIGDRIASAPYQHCNESDLTHASFTEIAKALDKEIATVTLEDSHGNLPPLSEKQIDEAAEIMKKELKPKSRKKQKINEVTEQNAPLPPLIEETIEVIPVNKVNGNTLIDKIVKGTAEGKLNHTIVTQIVRKHGLESTKDVFTNEHLIPAINDSIDELLRGG